MPTNKVSKTLELVFRLKDATSKELKKIKKAFDDSVKKMPGEAEEQMKKVNKAFKTIDIRSFDAIEKEIKQVRDAYKTLATSSKVSSKQLGVAAKAAKDKIKALKMEMKGAQGSTTGFNGAMIKLVASGYMLYRSLSKVVSTLMQFDDAMRAVGAISGATAGQYKQMTDLALEMGRTTRYTASQSAEALKYLSMAGFDATKSMESLPGVLQLAAAGSMDLGQAADITTNILTAYGKEASELGAVNDVLVETFTNTNSTLMEIGEAFKMVGPIAKGVGADFNGLVGTIGALHNAGLKGTMAGTALRGALGRLLNPTKDEEEMMSKLAQRMGGTSLQLRDLSGNFIGFTRVVEQLEQAGIRGDEALELFGLRAGPGMAALVNQGSESLAELDVKLANATGRAKEISIAMEAGIGGSMRRMKSAIEGTVIILSKQLEPGLVSATKIIISLAKGIGTLIETFGNIDRVTKVLIGTLIAFGLAAKVLGTGALLVGGFSGMAMAVGLLASELAAATLLLKVGLIGAVVFTTVQVVRLTKAILEWRDAMVDAEKVEADLAKQSKAMMEKYKQFADYKMPDDLMGKTPKQLEEIVSNLSKARAAQTAMSQERDAFGNLSLSAETAALRVKEIGRELKKVREAKVDPIGFNKLVNSLQTAKKINEDIAQQKDIFGDTTSSAIEAAVEVEKINKQLEAINKATIEITEIDELTNTLLETRDAQRKLAEEKDQFDNLTEGAKLAVDVCNVINKKLAELNERKVQIKIDIDKLTQVPKTIYATEGQLDAFEKQARKSYKAAIKEAEQYGKAVIAIDEKIRVNKMTVEDKIREMRQSTMSESDAMADKEYQIQEKITAARKAAAEAEKLSGDEQTKKYKESESYFKQAIDMAGTYATEVKNAEGVIVQTRKEGIEKAAYAMESYNSELRSKVLEPQKEAAQKMLNEQTELVKKLSTELDSLAQKRTAEVSVELKELEAARTEINKLIEEETKHITIAVTKEIKEVTAAAEGGLIGYAKGGLAKLRGKIPGWGNKDDVPGILTKGEYVITKEAVQRYGSAFMNSINNMALPYQGFAEGGAVGEYIENPKVLRDIEKLQKNIQDFTERIAAVGEYAASIGTILTSSLPKDLGGLSNLTAEEAVTSLMKYNSSFTDLQSKVAGVYSTEIASLVGNGNDEAAELMLAEQGAVSSLAESLAAEFNTILEEVKQLASTIAEEKKVLEKELEVALEEQEEILKKVRINARKVQSYNDGNYTGELTKSFVKRHFNDQPISEGVLLADEIGEGQTLHKVVDVSTAKELEYGVRREETFEGQFHNPNVSPTESSIVDNVNAEIDKINSENEASLQAIEEDKNRTLSMVSDTYRSRSSVYTGGVSNIKATQSIAAQGKKNELESQVYSMEEEVLDLWAELEEERRKWAEEMEIQEKGGSGYDNFAAGGFARRKGHIPGQGSRDDVPAMLMKGEFILKKDAVKKYGLGLLHALNSMSLPVNVVPKFAEGGLAWPKYLGGGGVFTDKVLHMATGGPVTLDDVYEQDPRILKKLELLTAEIQLLEAKEASLGKHSGSLTGYMTRNTPSISAEVSNLGGLSADAGLKALQKVREGAVSSKTSLNGMYNNLIEDAALDEATMDTAVLLQEERDYANDINDSLIEKLDEMITAMQELIVDVKERVAEAQATYDEALREQEEIVRTVETNVRHIEAYNRSRFGGKYFSLGEVKKYFGKGSGAQYQSLLMSPLSGDEGTEPITKPISYSTEMVQTTGMFNVFDNYGNFIRQQGNTGVSDLPRSITESFYNPYAAGIGEELKESAAAEVSRLGEVLAGEKRTIDDERKQVQSVLAQEASGIYSNFRSALDMGAADYVVQTEMTKADVVDEKIEAQTDSQDYLLQLEEDKLEWEQKMLELQERLEEEKEAEEEKRKREKEKDRPTASGRRKPTSGSGSTMYFAEGGVVPGVGNTDSVDAMVTPGEYVVKKNIVSKLGTRFFDAINNFDLSDLVMQGAVPVSMMAEGGLATVPEIKSPSEKLGSFEFKLQQKNFEFQGKSSVMKEMITELKRAGALRTT